MTSPVSSNPTSVALVAACMARNCSPEETDMVMAKLYSVIPAAKASDIQAQLETAIAEVKAGRTWEAEPA